MSTEVDAKPADPPLNGSASSCSGVSPLRSLRQMFPKTLSDKYRLGEELGRGAYGHVFRGLDTRTGQHVAIKQIGLERIPPGGLAGIIREVDLLKTLHHPNVVKYLGSLRTSTHLYIVLEFVENGALSSIIKSSSFGPFPESLVAIYVQQVLQGLAYLHAQGVVHRDIKGANILTTKEGIVKLADFGVAAQLSDLDASRPAGASLRSSGSSSPVGTAYWMAPEVVEMGGVTTAADIWSVGCLAVELFTGVPPYYELQPMSALYNIVADPHPPLPKNISAAMRDFLLRCFAKDPQKRPSAAELLEHAWLTYNRRTLRGTWSRTRGTRSTHTSVALVVERMLAADAGTVKGTDENISLRDSTAPAAVAIKEAQPEGSSSTQVEKRTSSTTTAKDEATTSSLIVSLDFADEDLTGIHLLEHLRSQGMALALSSRTLHLEDELVEAQHMELIRSVAKQVSALQVVRLGAQRDVVKEAGAAASCAALASLLRADDADRVRLVARSFVAQQGLPALRDLLDASSERLLDRAMDLVLCLLGPGPASDACLSPALAAGLIPAVLRFARPVHPHALRVVAAHIAEALSRTAQGTTVLLSADQLPALLDLLLGDEQSHAASQSNNNNVATAPLSLDLLQAALDCCWRLVLRAAADAPGMPSVNEIFRALARAGLAERMTAVLPAVLQAYRARASAGPMTVGVGMARSAHARSASVPLTETELALLVPSSNSVASSGTRVGAVPPHSQHHQPSSSINIAARTNSTGRSNGADMTTTTLHHHGAIHQPPPLPTLVGHGRPATAAMQPVIHEASSSSPGGHTASHLGSRSSTTTTGDASSLLHHHGGLPQAPRSPSRRQPPGRVVSQGTEPESNGDGLVQTTSSYAAAQHHHTNSPLPLLDAILNLYASMVYGDAVVKAALVTRPVLGPLFSITAALPPSLALTVVGAVRALTADREMHEALTNASGIAFLVAQLARPNEPLLQDQALSALHSLTADDLARQEQAAVAGTVPFLCQLGILPQRGAVAAHAHALAVSLLCKLARGSARTRAELWAHDALSVFLHLLKDEACQVEVLGALASWLEADTSRVENRLATGDALTRIVTLIPVMSATAGENEALCGVLAPLHHLLSVSPRLARELASNGLMPRVLELLRRRTASTILPALDVLAAMVAAHPQPKALAARFRLVPLLLPLAQVQVTDGVQRKATALLQTLRDG